MPIHAQCPPIDMVLLFLFHFFSFKFYLKKNKKNYVRRLIGLNKSFTKYKECISAPCVSLNDHYLLFILTIGQFLDLKSPPLRFQKTESSPRNIFYSLNVMYVPFAVWSFFGEYCQGHLIKHTIQTSSEVDSLISLKFHWTIPHRNGINGIFGILFCIR